jgi:hypothetical protein
LYEVIPLQNLVNNYYIEYWIGQRKTFRQQPPVFSGWQKKTAIPDRWNRSFLGYIRLGFSANSFVQVADEGIDVNAVSQSTLFDVFEVSGSAAQAAHASVNEYVNGVRVLLYNFDDAHIFSNSHYNLLR